MAKALLLMLILLIQISCSKSSKIVIEDVDGRFARLSDKVTSAQRFGYSAYSVLKANLDVASNWSVRGTNNLRSLNYYVEKEGECYVTVLQGPAAA